MIVRFKSAFPEKTKSYWEIYFLKFTTILNETYSGRELMGISDTRRGNTWFKVFLLIQVDDGLPIVFSSGRVVLVAPIDMNLENIYPIGRGYFSDSKWLVRSCLFISQNESRDHSVCSAGVCTQNNNFIVSNNHQYF